MFVSQLVIGSEMYVFPGFFHVIVAVDVFLLDLCTLSFNYMVGQIVPHSLSNVEDHTYKKHCDQK